jgi:hypothetical protein
MRKISDIDRAIKRNRRELLKREIVDTQSAASWQDAWDRHPRLWKRECDLFLERDLARYPQPDQL